MNYNRQVIPLVETKKMLSFLISSTHDFPIPYDIIEIKKLNFSSYIVFYY